MLRQMSNRKDSSNIWEEDKLDSNDTSETFFLKIDVEQ